MYRRLVRCLTLALYLCTLAFSTFAVDPDLQERVPMTDGTRLATDVYLPEQGTGPWPALLYRSVYGRYFPAQGEVKNGLRDAGYAIVFQDVRGMGTSEGKTDVFYADGWREDMHDGADTVAWIRAQPWCNGHVGSMGDSGLGMTAMLLGASTSDLGAQCIGVAPASFYEHALYYGGVLRQNLVTGWLSAVFQPHILPTYKAHPIYSEFWDFYNTVAHAEDITAPAVLTGKWYDIFLQGTLDAFIAREQHGGPGARGRNYLIMTARTHNGMATPDYRFRDGGGPSAGKLRRAFFDCHLKGDCAALEAIPKVQYFVLGADTPADAPGNEWRTAATWPPFETVPTPFQFQADGGMAREATATEDTSWAFTYDPKDPYPTHGGGNLFFNVPAGPWDQRKYSETRKDFLQFATAPLEQPLEVVGRISVTLFVSTDAPDTDFTAKLVDIYPEPDGRIINVLDGIRRLKSREGLDRTVPYTPGDVVDIEIDLWSTSIIFAPGHRVGLHVSSSNFPRFALNPNTGADFLDEGAESRVAHNAVHAGPAHASALILPLRKQ
ncbi:MAG TPA: CocE/NonD family hydrolase [Candidatus Hydrogenedentes bacterium]|nr:CocE/NonD family hydrolase [Candidatus Hydrogenedentota bacterium]HPG68569.1 CocE/NonD family hydrolase [Candidatus Hydrogenedentota bacterium]